MAIDTEHFKDVLRAREQELVDEIGRFEQNIKEGQVADVEDPLDAVTSSQTKAAAATETSIAADTLVAVRAALQRIDSGEFGICVDCDRPIGDKRLEAVPWTPYCLEDQEKHDQGKQEQAPATPMDSVMRLS